MRPSWVLENGSLRETEADGQVSVGADGRVVADVSLRRQFDYYLSTIGELNVAEIRRLVLDQLRGKYPDAVVQQVLDLLDRYVGYQRAVAELDPAHIANARERLQQIADLRRRYLGASVADAFFADEERQAQSAIDRMEVVADSSVSVEERRQRLQSLDAQTPPDLRAQRREADTAAIAQEQTRRFESSAADATARYAERSAVWGAEAAQRLAALDEERARWDARLAAYRQARDAVLADARRDAAQREAAVNAILSQSFSETERRRVIALEQSGILDRPGG